MAGVCEKDSKNIVNIVNIVKIVKSKFLHDKLLYIIEILYRDFQHCQLI